jgi:hypothetical protein
MSKYPNSGILGANKRKEKDSHPTHTGQCEVDGKAYWISAWVKDGKDGRFFSLSFKPKLQSDKGSPPTGGKNDPRPTESAFNDDIPF